MDKLAETRSRSEVAGFLLAPIQRPDLVMEILIERMKAGGRPLFRLPAAPALPAPAAARPGPIRLAFRGLAVVCVFMFLSCAVAPTRYFPDPTPPPAPGAAPRIEPLDNALRAGWEAARNLIDGEPLPAALAETFAGRLLQGRWTGLMLIDGSGEFKALARDGRGFIQVADFMRRQQRLEDENAILQEGLAAIHAVEQSKKVYLELNLEENKLRVKMAARTLYEFPVVSGKGYTAREAGWNGRFATPRGILQVQRKERDPVWYPPDWHWTEKGEEPPSSREPVRGHLGKYRLNLGQGYGIHGTASGRISPGKYSHGCIRMNAADLETVFKMVDVGTEVFIY